MKFKNYIETESGIKDTSTSPGTAGQVLSSTVTGTSWIDQDTLVSAASKLVVISCKNTSGSTINKGTPVYQTGTVGATDVIEVAPADATISSGSLPAIGILQTTLINNNDPVTDPGNVVITGEFLNYSTANIPTNNPGGVPITGDTVYLAPGGGLTCIKPTGAGNAIQNLGLIGKVSGGNAGSITVSSIMRANDVPNLPTGRIWIGDGNTIVSDTVYVDEPNSRVGIGTTSPSEKLTVRDGTSNTDVKILAYNSAAGTEATLKFSTIASETNYEKAAIIARNAAGSFGRNDMHFALDSTADSGNVQFSDTKMTILNGGNVGIGTTDPGAKLEVVGESGVIIESGTFNQAKLTLIGTAGTYGGGGIIDVIGAPSDFVAYNLNVKRSPNVMEASNFYSAFTKYWSWDGNMGGIKSQPYTSYDFKSQGSSQMVIYNNNVGIGTTSPFERLTIKGTDKYIAAEQTNYTWGSSFTIGAKIGTDASAGLIDFRRWTGTGNNHNNGIITCGGNSKGMDFRVDAKTSNTAATTSRMHIALNGNVGIGTDVPDSKLEVASTDSNTYVHVRNDSTGSTRLKMSNSSDINSNGFQIINNSSNGQVNLLNYKASTLALWTNSSQRLTILSGGNVGIGTPSPDTKLEVSSSSGGVLRLTSTDTSVAIGESIGKVEFKSNDASTGGNNVMGFVDCLATNAGSTYALTFGTGNAAAATEKMRINQSGNVGIGATNPLELLHLRSTGPARLLIEADTDNVTETDNAQIILKQDGGAVVGRLGYRTNTNDLELLNEYTSNIYLGTSNSIRATLHANGNFGIGNSTPQAKLHVSNGLLRTWSPTSGTSAIFESTVSNRNFVTLTAANEAELWFGNATIQAKGRVRYEMANNNMEFWTNGTQKMVIDGSGNVGIGATNPQSQIGSTKILDISSNGNGEVILDHTDAGTTSDIGLYSWNRNNDHLAHIKATCDGATDAAFISFHTQATGGSFLNPSSNEKMRIQSNGNVGIGTDDPAARLHVSEAGTASTQTIVMGLSSTSLRPVLQFSENTNAIITSGMSIEYDGRGSGTANMMHINGVDGAAKFTVTSGGNVGIGTILPAQKLHVVGRVASTSGNGFEIINSYGSPRLSDFYGSFYTSGPLYVGSPYSGQPCNASAFNITSDYRLKENEAPLTEASSRIKKLKPIRFNYISSENTVDGFLAHEVAKVIPEAVTGEKNAVREDGSDELQGLDLSKIVPLLTAALQESITKIEQLEQRIQTLENK